MGFHLDLCKQLTDQPTQLHVNVCVQVCIGSGMQGKEAVSGQPRFASQTHTRTYTCTYTHTNMPVKKLWAQVVQAMAPFTQDMEHLVYLARTLYSHVDYEFLDELQEGAQPQVSFYE